MQSTFELGTRMELMRRMGEAVGGDIFEALGDGRLNGFELFEAVQRCGACPDAETCNAWLAHSGPGGGGEAPHFCLNRGLMRRLAAEHRDGPAAA